ncbi:MAG: LPS export ABC transporter permease LptG [Candidatus Binatia bacterium]
MPIGGILDRYLISGFVRVFAISLLCASALYLIVDFFDRIDNFLRAGASLGTSVRYFLYKLPLLVSRVVGFATLLSTLFSLGTLSRTQETTAMRSSGLSLRRLALPLLLLSLLICLFNFFWNEALVPIFSRKSHRIYRTEVKKKPAQSLVGTNHIWIRGEETFISVSHVDVRRRLLEGVSIYLLRRDFSLRGLITVPSVHWNGTRWEAKGGAEWLFLRNGQMTQHKVPTNLPLLETPEDFKLLAQKPDELSFFDLQRKIIDLKEKGLDATEYEVDLQVKMAVPLISPLMVILAFPFAIKHGRHGGLALSFGLTMLIGFGYWFFLAFSISLGHSGVLPSWVAAWLPNLTLALVGLFFFTAEE